MNKIILASNNAHKIYEIKSILKGYEILSMKDIGCNLDIEETGNTYKENAKIKAIAVKNYISNTEYSQSIVLADDSGLSVDALNGEPGIYSSRYSGLGDEGNRQKLLEKLKGVENRSAHFYCCITIILPNGKEHSVLGKAEGRILESYRGSTDFGYDCLFYSNDLKKSFGEASTTEKNLVSHRHNALEQIKLYLDSL